MINYSELIEKAKKKDNDAITILYQETYKEAVFIARQTLRNNDDAEDIVQEAYIKAFQSLGTLKEAEKFRPWLVRIVTNKALDHLRKKKPALFSELPIQVQDKEEVDFELTLKNETEEYNPEDMLEKQAMTEIFDTIFASLSSEQRVCVLLYYREQMSVLEIAEFLQVSEGTVKSRLNYARKHVRQQVEAYEKDGLKLYSGMPILLWALRNHGGEEITIPDSVLSNILSAVGTTASTVAGSVSAVSSKTAISGKVAASGIATVKTKVIAGILAAGVAIGGGGVAINEVSHQNEIKNVQAIYERLLARGVYPGEMERNYYAMIDLNQDEIPELLVTDEIRPIWTDYEYYRYRDNILYKEDYGSNYAGTFYVVNDEALYTTSRANGDTYLSLTSDGITVEAYTKSYLDFETGENSWLAPGSKEDWNYYQLSTTEANYNNLSKEKIPESEYKHYCNTSEGNIMYAGYVESIEPIIFEKNTFRKNVNATEEELLALLEVAERFRSNPNDILVEAKDYSSAAAWYGLDESATGYFTPVRIETVAPEGHEILVYKKTDMNYFFSNIVGLNRYMMLPEYTGEIDFSDDWYVYERDGEIYIMLDGLGGWEKNTSRVSSYQENGNGTATAIFESMRWYDDAVFTVELIVQRSEYGELQIKEYGEV